jgi:RNA polymerase sigma-70 factor, ECF subfamily
MNDEALRALMAGYQDGDLESFDRLYAALEDELRSFFGARCRDAVRVDDLLQDTFLQIHRSRRSYLRRLPVRPWVYAIANRALLMHFRKVNRREAPEATALSSIPEPSAAAAGTIAARVEMTDALARIPADGRRAFLLHHWAGFTFREIAAALGIEPGTAKLRSSRAAHRLRRMLTRETGGRHACARRTYAGRHGADRRRRRNRSHRRSASLARDTLELEESLIQNVVCGK